METDEQLVEADTVVANDHPGSSKATVNSTIGGPVGAKVVEQMEQ